MKVLVVGGTGFLGGAVAADAVAAGHDVTVFTRGLHGRVPSPAKALVGDRHEDLSAVRGKHFDLVVDTCAFAPEAVVQLLDSISPEVGRYALVSSASVYSDFARPGCDESAPTVRATGEQLAIGRNLPPDQRAKADAYGDAYGPLKREAELAALERLGDRAFILRSGLLVGAGDYTDRLTYWVRRVDLGGRVAAPGDPLRPVQLIDVRDAAAFIVDGASRALSGVFNLTGRPISMSVLLHACQLVSGSSAQLVWMADEVLEAAGIADWTEMPLWLSPGAPEFKYILEISAAKAIAHGLKPRPLENTLASILSWDRTRRTESLKAGLPHSKEALLLSRYPMSPEGPIAGH